MADPKKDQKQRRYRRTRLGYKIVSYMILASAVLSLFASSIQIFAQYKRSLGLVKSELELVNASFSSGLQNALWKFDFQQVDLLVDAILARENVAHVVLAARSGETFERGALTDKGVLTETIDLAFQRAAGVSVPVGTLTVTTSLEQVYADLWAQGIVLILSNFAKTLAASFVMFWIFERMVSRHLLRISGSVQTPEWIAGEASIDIPRSVHARDEIDEIVDALNTGAHEIRAAGAEARLLRNRLETVLNTATSGIVALNPRAEVVFLNPSARHLLGGISDAVPFPWPSAVQFVEADALTPLDASADPIKRALTGHDLHAETHLMSRHPEDPGRYVRVESKKLDNPRDDISTVLVIEDVSNQERNRQVVERKSRLDALGQLTGGIAHDFNNLLASMLYAVDLAQRQEDKERRDALLNIAADSIDRGRELTSRLLAFAKKQPGLAESRSISVVFAEFEKMIRPMIESSLSISVHVDEEDLQVFCDHAQLETALMNLVLNSRDAILRGGRGNAIKISARSVAFPKPEALPTGVAPDEKDTNDAPTTAYRFTEISVSDNGPGMTKETRARATDPFFTTKSTNSGTGLGLSIVYGFVRQADGDLRIYSEEGVGTTINLVLPRGTKTGEREAPVPLSSPIEGAGQTILLVEDEENLLVLMVEVLVGLGYQVLQAHSGNEALDMIEAGAKFDLLLTDVVMPGKMGGFELARRMRVQFPQMPVIYISGYTGFTPQEMGEVQAPILQKPCPPFELAAALHDALSPEHELT